MALKTTAEKVLKRSNKPKTDFGMIPVPSAPIIMAARQPIAQLLREGRRSFLPPMAMSHREMMESSTTNAVTRRCITF